VNLNTGSILTVNILLRVMASQLSRVLISDAVDPKCVKILQDNDVQVDYKPNLPLSELLKEIKLYDGLIVRSATKVTKEVITAGTNLKIIGRAGTGVDNIDSEAATDRGIIVMNTPGGNTLSAAEHTCAMILAASRLIPQGYASLQGEKWERSKLMGNEVYGKTLAILGLGRIGREVAHRMQSFGMKTIGYDPIIPPEVSKEFGVEGMTLEAIWPLADYITLHVPLMPETKGLIGEETLKKCKKSVIIVNVSRGGVVDEQGLLQSLKDGNCGGAALDVFEQEPPKDFSLIHHPKVVSTPHLGANTREAQSRVAEEIAEQFVDFARGRTLIGVVNAPTLNEALAPGRKPWVDAAQSLGKLTSAITCSGKAKSCKIAVTSYGSDLQKVSGLMGSAALVGVIQKYTGQDGANLINISKLAADAGVQLQTSFSVDRQTELVAYGDQGVKVQTQCDASGHVIVGTVQGKIGVVLSIDGAVFKTPVPLQGNLLVYKVGDVKADIPLVIVQLVSGGAEVNAIYQTWTEARNNYIIVNTTTSLQAPVSTGSASYLAQINV